MNNRLTVRRVIDLFPHMKAGETVEVPNEIQIMMPGVWDTPYHGAFAITLDDLPQFVHNFNSGLRKGYPIDIEHEDGGIAVGWITELADRGMDGLWAVVDWTDTGLKLLQDRAYRFFSPEWCTWYLDPETGQEYENVLVGGAITNRPLFKNLQPIMASETSKRTSESTLYVANIGDMPKPIATKADENNGEVPVETTESTTVEETVETTTEEKKEETPVEEPKAEESTTIEASDKISGVEIARLQLEAAEGRQAKEELRRMKAGEKVEGWLVNKDGGKFLPNVKEQLTDFVLTMNDSQAAAFDKIVESIPNSDLLQVKGADEGGSIGSPAEKLHKLAETKAASDNLSYSKALKAVREEHRELANAADQPTN